MKSSRFVLLSLLAATTATAADLQGQARVWAGPGVDSNARRDFVSWGVATVPDGFAYALGQLDGLAQWPWGGVSGSYDIGARKFLFLGSEDTLIQSAQLEGTVFAGRMFAFGLLLRGRDRRGADRDYTDLQGDAVVDYTPDKRLSVRLRGGAHRFLYWKRFTYSFSGPDFTGSVQYRFDRHWGLMVFGNYNLRTYNDVARNDPNDGDPPPTTRRSDSFIVAGFTGSYRGKFQASLGYSYTDQGSNSWGESIRRHRITGTLGLRLPFQAALLVSGALQFSNFPDGLYLSSDLTVVEDDENSSSLTLKVVRPLSDHVDVDLRYAVYGATLPQPNWLYLRHVGSIGLSATF